MLNQQGVGAGVKVGIRTGIPLAVLTLFVWILSNSGREPAAMQNLALQNLAFLIALVCFFYAGMTLAHQSRWVTGGALAGGVCSLFPAVVLLGVNVVMAVVVPAQFAQAFGYYNVTASGMGGSFIMQSLPIFAQTAFEQSLRQLVVWTIAGLVLGALGGWVGSRRQAQHRAGMTPPLIR